MLKFLLIILAILLYSSNVQAYVGPGLGLGVIGVIAGVLLSIVMAILGIFWYPLKRMFKKKNNDETLNENMDGTLEEKPEEKDDV